MGNIRGEIILLAPPSFLPLCFRDLTFTTLTETASVLAYLNSSLTSLEGSTSDHLGRTYYLLLYVPPEYLTRQARVELVRRAVEGDVTISSALHTNREETANRKRKRHEASDQETAWKTLSHIRVFLHRMGQLGYLNTSDYDVCFICCFVSSF